MPPKKERTGELRDKLIALTIEVLGDEGVTGVTTRSIARRGGASAPAIYELFADKAGLIRAVFFEGFRRLGAGLDLLPPPSGSSDDLVATMLAFRAFTLANPRLFEVMYTRPFADFSPTAEEQTFGNTTREHMVGRARACVEAGNLQGDPLDIAHGLLALGIGLATQECAGWLGADAEACTRRWAGAVRALLDGYGAAANNRQT